MQPELLRQLENKSMTVEQLRLKVERDVSLRPDLLKGISSSKAAVRYGCAKVLMDLSATYPEKLYSHMAVFIGLLDSEYILAWNALAIIANLAKIDRDKKFDAAFDKYYSFLNDEHVVTMANVVGNSGKIALVKPQLIQMITDELLRVENA